LEKSEKQPGVFKAWNIYYIIMLAMCTVGKEFPNHIPLNPKETSPNPNASLLHAFTTGSLQKLTHKRENDAFIAGCRTADTIHTTGSSKH
jgi:hypothetical protein